MLFDLSWKKDCQHVINYKSILGIILIKFTINLLYIKFTLHDVSITAKKFENYEVIKIAQILRDDDSVFLAR